MRFHHVLAAAVPFAIAAVTYPAHGQRVAEPGDRIRITVPGLYTDFAAVLIGVEGDSVRVRSRQLEIGIPLSAVTSVERSVARRPRYEAMLFGGVGSAAIGWIVASFLGLCDTVDSDSPDSRACVPLIVGTFGVGGVMAGLLFAVTNPEETWAPASLSPAVQTIGRLPVTVGSGFGTRWHLPVFRLRF